MTYEEINEMMQEIGMPFAYHHFAEGESPKPPFVIFLSPGEDTFGADNLMYHSFKQLDVELYTDSGFLLTSLVRYASAFMSLSNFATTSDFPLHENHTIPLST